MEAEKLSSVDEPSVFSPTNLSPPHTWEDGNSSSASELLDRLIQLPLMKPSELQKKLTAPELLKVLNTQGAPAPNITTGGIDISPSKLQNQFMNQDSRSVAIDQCDITSPVDYGSRDYYHSSKDIFQTPQTYKSNELEDLLYKNGNDTRGSLWEGSLYY